MYVYTMTVHDDGRGAALYVGGYSDPTMPGFTANRVAKWDGTTWSALSTGIDDPDSQALVEALCSYDDGTGPALYVGGRFTVVGGAWLPGLARWDGSNWSSVGGGLVPPAYPDCTVYALAAFDSGAVRSSM